MVADKPVIDAIAAYDPDTCECVLSNNYKRGIKAVLPPGIKPPDALWRVLTDIVSKFLIMEKCRAVRRSPAAEIKRWQRIAKLATEAVQNSTSEQVKILAQGQVRAYEAFKGDFRRKKNRNNEALYIWILEDLWCGVLRQELGISVNKKVPGGRLVKFFGACVNPLLPRPLTPHAIVTIRDRVRKRREELRKASEIRARRRTKVL